MTNGFKRAILLSMRNRTEYSLGKIASELDVSKAAVSFVLNGNARRQRISQKMEKRIIDFCDKVGYRPNIHAQRMNKPIVKNVGILIENRVAKEEISPFTEYNISQVIAGITWSAEEAGFRFAFKFYSEGMDKQQIFEWCVNRDVDGIIYYGFGMPDDWLELIRKRKLNVVGVSITPSQGIPCVNVDNYDSSYKLTKYLTSKGRRKFLYLAGDQASHPGNERYRAFRDALKEEKINFKEDNFYRANFIHSKAEKIIRERWMHGELKEDAIVCANDDMAVGVISALTKAGVLVPEQVAVVGADNISLGRFITPSITTFDYLPFEQGQAAFKLFYKIIHGETKPENILLKSTLHLRQSG